ncbi:Hypothetical Protein FCC1311_001822 [Hondaea fermentalgiana]|uniref:Uncharacterized protein n=1 Tax=Hondaea fermentalgiana TaxID=2315210 RepID=A0A2R5G699_9STRA|nr:Hypothetical Protein FCC1311_001822 [Hondaea fermentalgiana]|eukprot:GBG23963.1 Hypothetical Protein FCC1311_001822 [Hondaea fermentalgiana]
MWRGRVGAGGAARGDDDEEEDKEEDEGAAGGESGDGEDGGEGTGDGGDLCASSESRDAGDFEAGNSVTVSVTKYMDDGSMTDVEIKLDTTKFANVNDQVGSIFKKVRRMERGVAVVEEKLLASMEKQEVVEGIAEDLDQCDPGDETAFARIDRAATDHKALDWPPRERQQPLSSRKKANPGSHVLVRMFGSLREPSEETLQRAADLTALYSKLKAEAKVPITLADPRQIRKAPRSPVGTVMLLGELGTMIGQPSRVQDLEEVDQDSA